MERPMTYRLKSLKELLDAYAHAECTNQEEADMIKKNIMNEVNARVKTAFDLLDYGINVDDVYKQFIEY